MKFDFSFTVCLECSSSNSGKI